MPQSPLNGVIQHLLADLRPDGDTLTDGELLARFLRSRDDDAVAVLVRRHAAMVWGVCCRLLRHHQDAEDAFQATFLVLVRKAPSVPRQAVANWLYGVARQTAVRLRATAAKRGRRETQVVNMPEPGVRSQGSGIRSQGTGVGSQESADLQDLLDEELGRLPSHYRSVVVLCDLEGMTRKEAARQLGIPEGSVASRLARARGMLAKRLTRRGVFSAGTAAAVLSESSAAASAPSALVASTIQAATLLASGKAAATAAISARVAGLAEGVVRTMFLAKLKTATCALALTVVIGLGGLALVSGGVDLPTAGAATAPAPGALALEQAENSVGQPAKQAAAKPVTIRGKVVDDATGKPITRFIVQSGKFDPSDPGFDPTDPRKVIWLIGEQPQNAPDGSFSTMIRWAEGRTARIVADGYLRQPLLTSAPPSDKDEIEVTIRLQRVPEKVRGVVFDHTGKPVKDAAIFTVGSAGLVLAAGQAWSRGWPGENRKDQDARPVMTDEQGRFEIDTNGTPLLGVTHARFDAWPAAVPANGEVTIRLPRPARLEIDLDIDGAGKECVVFYQLLAHVTPEFGTLQSSRYVNMANPGKRVFDALPPGKYQLYRTGAGILDNHIFDVKSGETKTIDYVRNKGARVRGKVTWPADGKVTTIVVSILDEKNTVHASLSPSEDGTFLTERIPPGTHSVIAYAFAVQTPERLRNTSPIPPSYHAEPRKVVVPAEGEVTVADLVLKPIQPKKAESPAAQPKPPPAKTDQERMVGGWVIVKSEGQRNRKGENWIISNDEIVMAANVAGFRVHWHYHRLDAGKDPKQIDITVKKSNGEFIGLIKGIYALPDDTELRLCLGEMGKDRPTAFAGKAGESEFLILHGGDPAAWQRKAAKEKPNPEADKLVRQLGDASFEKRQAAEKALTNLGARASAAVRAGMKDTEVEIARRCEALWPRLWQAEIDRPEADRLAGYDHALWARFRKVVGDDAGSRILFADMAADVKRFSRLEAAETEPDKAGAAYAAEMKLRNEAIERGRQEAMAKYKYMTGPIIPTSGQPTRGEFAALLFLGTYAATAKDEGGDIQIYVFSSGIGKANSASSAPVGAAFRRLYVAWLATRTAPQPLQIGLRLAYYNSFAEALPTALVHAANDKLDPTARGFALLTVGRVGTAEHLPLLEKAFADQRVYLMGNFSFKDGKNKATETRVSDTAVTAALRIAKQDPADFGFTFMEMYRENSKRDANEHNLLGFLQDDDAARQAAHKKAREWLEKRGKEKM